MTSDADTILREALQLDEHDRADLITALVASLDGEPDADEDEIARLWTEEASRRAEQYFNGETTAGDADIVTKRIRADLNRR